jgi:hypothetical protein
MKIRTSVLCAVLLTCSGCAASSWNASTPPPPPIDCDPQALSRCEALLIESDNAPLSDVEEIDAINRERVLRCYQRHAAALACFEVLRKHGVVSGVR